MRYPVAEPNPYLDFLRRRYWLIALGVLIAVFATYVALGRQTPLYRSTATIQVGSTSQEKSPDQNDLAVTDRLTPFYAELAKRDPVLNAATAALGLNLSADAVRARLLVLPVSGTQLIDISIVDANPQLAASLANEIARQVVLQSPSTATEDSTQTFIQAQLVDLQMKIVNAQEEVARIESDITGMSNAADIYDAQQRTAALAAQIDTWQNTYGVLLAQIEPGTTNTVRLVNPASAAMAPLSRPTLFYYGLALVLGAALGALAGLLFNALGGALRQPADVEPLTDQTPIITIPRYRMARPGMPVSLSAPDSAAGGAYRVLRNVIRSMTPNGQGTTLLVTSSRPGEGKTTTTANLGIALANSGLRVILVDANLRFPELDIIFDVPESPGLTDVLTDEAPLEAAVWATRQPQLSIVPSGSERANFADLLASQQLSDIVKALATLADVVIYDTPALLQEQETMLLAKEVDSVILVAEAGQVRGPELAQALELLEQAETPAALIALNKVRVPRWSRERLPWSREARQRARRERRRQAAERERRVPAADHVSTSLGD